MKPVRIRAVGEVAGLEHIIVLAVRAQEQEVNFNALAQPSIERARAVDGGTTRGMKSAFGQLLEQAAFGGPGTRAARVVEVQDYKLQRFTWRIETTTRPKPMP
jgi:hypothetical protein